ncbi:hypothetical protein J7E86_24695 [Streptomyces sp. ISL-11]|nr:hypothetical protein [Streptomyces sp. ISL-11]MBT2386709.1 hypothetical protein [Streptomyces sp. ISL-11]
MTYDEIRAELGCSKSSISAWVRDLPKPAPRWAHVERMQRMEEAQTRLGRERDEERRRLAHEASLEVGGTSDRELLLVGVALYWAEGQKDKAYARRECISFINSDPQMIRVFVRWLELLGVGRDRLRCSLHIHDSADITKTTRFWSDLIDVPTDQFWKPCIKKDNPGTNRLNRGESYRGCLKIYVTNSARLYRRIEGWWYGIVVAARKPDQVNRT